MKILCTQALESVFHAILPHVPGDSVVFGTTGGLVAQVEARTGADLILASRAALDELARMRKVEAGSVADIASTAVGIAVKPGVGRLDLSSAEALRKLLLAAGPIAYSDPAGGGGSGVHFAQLLYRLGIADQVNRQAIQVRAPGNAGSYVMTGEAALAVQMISELKMVPGIEIAGPLPADCGKIITFSGALISDSTHAQEALDVIRALKTPAAGKIMQAAGLTPA